jgi:hypothetical protein
LFCELKQQDLRDAPPFEQTWQRASKRRWDRTSRGLTTRWIAVAVLLLLVVSVVIVLCLRPPTARPLSHGTSPNTRPASFPPLAIFQSDSIVDWQSPTSYLLEMASSPSSERSSLPPASSLCLVCLHTNLSRES